MADSILPYVKDNNAVLLANHGALTWGKDLWQAFTRMETLERCAQIYLQVRALGTPQYLTPRRSRNSTTTACAWGILRNKRETTKTGRRLPG